MFLLLCAAAVLAEHRVTDQHVADIATAVMDIQLRLNLTPSVPHSTVLSLPPAARGALAATATLVALTDTQTQQSTTQSAAEGDSAGAAAAAVADDNDEEHPTQFLCHGCRYVL